MRQMALAAAVAVAVALGPVPVARAADCGYLGKVHASSNFYEAGLGLPFASAGVVLDGGCELLSGTGWMNGWCNSAYGAITFNLDWIQPGYRLTSQFVWQAGVVTLTGDVTGTAVMAADVTTAQTCLPMTPGAHDFVISLP